jgi:hypothetical protein
MIPDPERMSLFAADESFQLALPRAWRQAGADRISGTLLWSVETTQRVFCGQDREVSS